MISRLTFAGLLLAGACSGGLETPPADPAPAPAPDPGAGEGTMPSAAPQHILDMEERAWAMVNLERVSESLSPLHHDETLREVARAHSQDMVDRDFFAHVNLDGLDPFDRMALAGVTFLAAAENIAWNMGYSDPAAVAVDGWMNSPGHRGNILNGQYTFTGMGAAESPAGGFYFTQVFVLPTGSLVLEGWRSSQGPGLELPLERTSSWSTEEDELR